MPYSSSEWSIGRTTYPGFDCLVGEGVVPGYGHIARSGERDLLAAGVDGRGSGVVDSDDSVAVGVIGVRVPAAGAGEFTFRVPRVGAEGDFPMIRGRAGLPF